MGSLYGSENERSEYGNPAIWLVHKPSDIFRIACSEEEIQKTLLISNKK